MEPVAERLDALHIEDEPRQSDDSNDGPDMDAFERLRSLLPPEFRLARSSTEPLVPHPANQDTDTGDAFDFSFSEADLVPAQRGWEGAKAARFHQQNVEESQPDFTSQRLYSLSPDQDFDPRITVSRSQLISDPDPTNTDPLKPPSRVKSPVLEPGRSSRSLSRTFSNLRKGRFGRPDSPSPEKAKQKSGKSTPKRQNSGRDSGYGSATVKKTPPVSSGPRVDEHEPPRKSTNMFKRRSLKMTVNPVEPVQAMPNTTPLRSASPRRLQVTPTRSLSDMEPPLSKDIATRHLKQIPGIMRTGHRRQSSKSSEPRKKDDLFTVFRQLDESYQKFQAKTSTLKAGVVKASIMPFLNNYAEHPSNRSLHPEDLERRIGILNKWWTGMLDMVDGNNQYAVSGSDRAILLDAISGIMGRPEWRAPPSPFAPLEQRPPVADRRDSQETTSSQGSDFLVESVQHSIRNMFVSNLFTQVVLVVDRMSLRHAPASLVAFGGKTCAYAFFFCPGIADILVRLWNVQLALIKRVLNTHDLPKTNNFHDTAGVIANRFPQAVQDLAFTSLRDIGKVLRQKPILPLGVEKVQWYGHWLGRWTGRDSDLFYTFVKHYFSLASDFLPVHASPEERICAPGYVLIQAQLLANLDSTINRTSSLTSEPSMDAGVTFDDLLLSDGSASALPPPPLNATRLMADNRIIMLMREMFAENRGADARHCLFFADSIGLIMRASARSTSVYNHSACFTLCDFLQEAFVILLRFQHGVHPDRDFLNWPFWLEVFRTMLKSQNTMTEIRLYSLLFTIWTSLTVDEAWRIDLCRSLLLEETHFHQTFQHWCPMVRAYYMRLVCWRIARFDGDASDAEVAILKMLISHLHRDWRHFRYLLNQSNHDRRLLPSTAPCNPAPGRRLLIIRTDSPVATAVGPASMPMRSMPILDERDAPPQQSPAATSTSSLFDRLTMAATSGGDPTTDGAAKKPGMFRSILSYRFSSSDRARSLSPQPEVKAPAIDTSVGGDSSADNSEDNSESSSPEDNSQSRSSMYESRPQRPLIDRAGSSLRLPPDRRMSSSPSKTVPFNQANFKFSLEPVDRRPQNLPQEMRLQPPRVPLAAQLLLQSLPDYAPDLRPKKSGVDAHLWTYTGRALAEWSLVVNECSNFFERRRSEGVPNNKLVETPLLGVESFRRPG